MINKFWNLKEYNFGELAASTAPHEPYGAATIDPTFPNNFQQK